MHNSKQQYLDSIRANKAYPAYRGFISIITMLGFLMAGAIGLGALVTGLGMMTQSFLTGFVILLIGAVYAAIVFFLAKYFREAALILVDIGDSIVDSNSRNSAPASFTAGAPTPYTPPAI